MAKCKVKAVRLVSPLSQKAEVLNFLQAKGTMEIRQETALSPPPTDPDAERATLKEALGAIEKATAELDARAPEKKGLLSMLEPREEVEETAFFGEKARAEAALETAKTLLELTKQEADLGVERTRLQTKLDLLEPWKTVSPVTRVSPRVSAVTGLIRRNVTREEILSAVARDYPEIEAVEVELYDLPSDITDPVAGPTILTAYCLTDDAEEVETSLKNFGFVNAPGTDAGPYAEQAAAVEAALAENEAQKEKLGDEILSFASARADLRFAADYYTALIGQTDASSLLGQTERVFVVTGFAEEKDAEKLKKQAEKRFDAAVELTDPGPDDDPPVILKNGFFSAPLQNITGMYSLPSKTDIDPTSFMSFFYYLFFGMMLSDAGYGLVIALATGGVLLFKKNLEPKMKNTMKMYLFCGLSTVFWGAMYGSWFGDAPAVIAREFFHAPAGFNPMPPIWTDAVTDTMNVLIMCFILGLAHLFWGVCMKGYTDLKNGRKLDAVFDTIPTFVTVIGIAPIFFGLFVQDHIPENYPALGRFLYNIFMAVHTSLSQVNMYILIAGLALVICTAGRHSKGIVGKVGGGLYEVYSLFSGYLGDVLSYARLLALGMATGVIGQVMNMLGTLPKNPVIKLPAFILVFIAGHVANLAINLIGAYVHTNRLQYVEFFSKFYEGGGRAFVPFEATTKYYRFKEEQ